MEVSNDELLRAYEMQQRRRKCNAEYMQRYRAQHQNRDEWNRQQRVMYLKRKANNLVNHDNLSANALGTQGVDVTSSNVYIGLKVRRGRHWNTKKWRDDIDSSSDLRPKPRVCGQVIGFTDADGHLVGENSGREYATDRITEANGPEWAVVRWDTGKSSTYPIGSDDLYSLQISEAT